MSVDFILGAVGSYIGRKAGEWHAINCVLRPHTSAVQKIDQTGGEARKQEGGQAGEDAGSGDGGDSADRNGDVMTGEPTRPVEGLMGGRGYRRERTRHPKREGLGI